MLCGAIDYELVMGGEKGTEQVNITLHAQYEWGKVISVGVHV